MSDSTHVKHLFENADKKKKHLSGKSWILGTRGRNFRLSSRSTNGMFTLYRDGKEIGFVAVNKDGSIDTSFMETFIEDLQSVLSELK